MKILFAEPHELPLYCFRKELFDELIARNHEIVLVTTVTDKIIDEYSKKVSKIIDLPLNLKDKRLFSNISLKKKYKKIIYSEKPDIILSFQIKPNLYCGFSAKNTPMIANITGLGRIFEKKNILSHIGIQLYRKSFKNVDYVFFQNNSNYDFFVNNKIPINHYAIIPGSGVNVLKFNVDNKVLPPLNETHFLYASRAIKEKGFYLLIEAIPAVVSKNNNVHFNFLIPNIEHFSGKHKEILSSYKKYISVLPRTYDITNIYRSNSFLVSPSFYKEGISNVLLESLACGRPIITTNDNPGCKEVLVEGVNGFGVKSNDLESLVEALLKAASLSIQQVISMGMNGREFVKKKFNRQIVVDTYLKTIEKIHK